MPWVVKCDDWINPKVYAAKPEAERIKAMLDEMGFKGACSLEHRVEEVPDDRAK